jgi:hypothetical protein
MEAKRGNDRRWTLATAYALNRHQPNRFQCAMIKAASISLHATIVAASSAEYNRNVVLIIDR